MTDFEVLGTVAIGKASPLMLSMTLLKEDPVRKSRKKKDEKFEKIIFTLSERTGLAIGKEVETS